MFSDVDAMTVEDRFPAGRCPGLPSCGMVLPARVGGHLPRGLLVAGRADHGSGGYPGDLSHRGAAEYRRRAPRRLALSRLSIDLLGRSQRWGPIDRGLRRLCSGGLTVRRLVGTAGARPALHPLPLPRRTALHELPVGLSLAGGGLPRHLPARGLSSPFFMDWFERFLQRLLDGSPPVAGLLAGTPFGNQPPRMLRVDVYR